MPLIEKQLFGTVDKVKNSLARLKEFEPDEGYYLAFSGGKDSIVIKHLAIEAGVKFEAVYNVTTIDPPELLKYMKQYHTEVTWKRLQPVSMLKMIETKGFPIRQVRWCCEFYKEGGGEDRRVLTGVRWAESPRRKLKRKMIEWWPKQRKMISNPIIDWTDKDVWDYIHDRKLPYCELYDQGYKRLGCLMCPMASSRQRLKESLDYPRWTEAFRRSFRRLYANRKAAGRTSVDRWTDGDAMFDWWLTGEGSGDPDSCGGLFE